MSNQDNNKKMVPRGAVAIPLHGAAGAGLYALVDKADAPLVAGYTWRALRQGSRVYAQSNIKRNGKWTTLLMQRLLLPGAPQHIDHINGDGLDNRCTNLRPATRAQNARNQRLNSGNTSGFKGVRFHARAGKWQAGIGHEGKRTHLGLFATAREAAIAYDAAAKLLHGEFAKTNAMMGLLDATGGTAPPVVGGAQ